MCFKTFPLSQIYKNVYDEIVLLLGISVSFLFSSPEHKIHTTECIENLRQWLNCLPKAHQNLLQFLSAFLLKVATHSAVNFMTLENLAIVFGPTLFK